MLQLDALFVRNLNFPKESDKHLSESCAEFHHLRPQGCEYTDQAIYLIRLVHKCHGLQGLFQKYRAMVDTDRSNSTYKIGSRLPPLSPSIVQELACSILAWSFLALLVLFLAKSDWSCSDGIVTCHLYLCTVIDTR